MYYLVYLYILFVVHSFFQIPQKITKYKEICYLLSHHDQEIVTRPQELILIGPNQLISVLNRPENENLEGSASSISSVRSLVTHLLFVFSPI